MPKVNRDPSSYRSFSQRCSELEKFLQRNNGRYPKQYYDQEERRQNREEQSLAYFVKNQKSCHRRNELKRDRTEQLLSIDPYFFEPSSRNWIHQSKRSTWTNNGADDEGFEEEGCIEDLKSAAISRPPIKKLSTSGDDDDEYEDEAGDIEDDDSCVDADNDYEEDDDAVEYDGLSLIKMVRRQVPLEDIDMSLPMPRTVDERREVFSYLARCAAESIEGTQAYLQLLEEAIVSNAELQTYLREQGYPVQEFLVERGYQSEIEHLPTIIPPSPTAEIRAQRPIIRNVASASDDGVVGQEQSEYTSGTTRERQRHTVGDLYQMSCPKKKRPRSDQEGESEPKKYARLPQRAGRYGVASFPAHFSDSEG